jgi:hypothetical protein
MMMIGGDKSTSASNLASGWDVDKLKPRPMGNHQSGAESILEYHGAGTCHGHRQLSIGSERLRTVNEDASGGFYERA